MIDAWLAGLLTGLSLIVAIGAQNAYVLRQGLRRNHTGPVVTVCALSDFILITAGVTGVGAIVTSAAWALRVTRWLGVGFLTWYGLSAARRARRPSALPVAAGDSGAGRLIPVLARTGALTWLNPHVYLDTVVLLGSVANAHGSPGRWWFAAGACLASALWFTMLGYGARFAARLLTAPRAWQILDLFIAATMLAVAVRLAAG